MPTHSVSIEKTSESRSHFTPLASVVRNREMSPCREHNFCCGGGGGFNGLGRYRQQRNIGLKIKRDQILATGAKLVIAPCHNCWDAIRYLEEVFKIGIRWSFLKPLLIKMIEVPEHLKPPEE